MDVMYNFTQELNQFYYKTKCILLLLFIDVYICIKFVKDVISERVCKVDSDFSLTSILIGSVLSCPSSREDGSHF